MNYINTTTMKCQCSVILLLMFKVVNSYPSSDTDTYPESIFSSFEIINPAVGIPSPCSGDDHIPSEVHFPDVEYPTKMLVDTIQPFFYRAADHDDILSPFTSDVKDSYNSLKAEIKVKETAAHEDCSGAPFNTDLNIQHSIQESDDSQTSSESYNPVEFDNATSSANANDTKTSEINNCQTSIEEEVEVIKDVVSEDSNGAEAEPVPGDTTEAMTATEDDSAESKQSDEAVSLNSEDEENL